MRIGRRMSWLGILAFSLFLSVHINGCSLIGLIVGTAIDSGKPKARMIPAHEALEISPGAHVAFRLKDSTTVVGTYRGAGTLSADAYAPRYGSWRDSLPAGERPPALGDSITLTLRTREPLRTTFAGFGYRKVMVGAATGPAGAVLYEDLVSLSGPEGSSIPAYDLVRRDVSGDLPSMTTLRVVNGRDTSLTAIDRIATVEIRTPRHAAATGFFVGLAIDVIVVAVAAASYQEPEPSSGCETSSSNPYGSRVQPLEAPFDVWAGRLVTETDSTSQSWGGGAAEQQPRMATTSGAAVSPVLSK